MSTNDNLALGVPVPWYKEITTRQWKVLIAGFLGWGMDAFDFLLYNFTILAIIKEWGISTSETGLVASVTVVSSALGGCIFGVVADRMGRMKALTLTILLYSVASGFCGLSQNIWQLMLFRVLVGIGMGGEWSAGAALISETWPAKHKGKAMAIMQSAYALGGMLAGLVAGPVAAAFGWRALFFLGIAPALICLWIRYHVEESEMWVAQKEKIANKQIEDKQWTELFKGAMLKNTLLATAICTVFMIASLPTTIWLPTYLGMPVAQGGAGLSIVKSSWFTIPYFLGSFVGYLGFGFLIDWIGRKKSFALFFAASLIAVPVYMRVPVSEAIFICLTFLVGLFVVGYYGGFGVILGELFPTTLRATGQGLAYNIGRGITAFGITFVGSIQASIGGLGNALMITTSFFVLALLLLLALPETKGKALE
ncbi:MAG TPA: MFS transporter [Selenomonadales bacterium]|nr:MFS transporter [Selenomonadales bacterium]